MSEISSSAILAEMRRMATEASNNSSRPNGTEAQAGFSEMLKGFIDSVNEMQQQSARMTQDFALERNSVDVAEVMVTMQRARIYFEAMLQARNRLVRAYEEIMRMPV